MTSNNVNSVGPKRATRCFRKSCTVVDFGKRTITDAKLTSRRPCDTTITLLKHGTGPTRINAIKKPTKSEK